MRKEFNTTGSCNPEWHYMVDTEKRFKAVEEMIDGGEYFTINRARQYGKTTMLQVISDRLSNQYRLIIFNAKELDEDIFQYVKKLNESNRDIGKPIVLLVDDADEYGNQLRFISFLGFLRNNYLEREKFGQKSTIHSVILACKQDIRNIVVYDSFGDRVKNSPWNIAADFNVDMTFHPEEIAQMLRDYENDTHTGMDIKAISEEIYKYTSGYPYLVSAICKIIDERLEADWNLDNVQQAVKIIAKGENVTLIDDLSKNIENNAELRDFLFSIVVNGQEYSYTMIDPIVRLANMFSYIKENRRGKAMIHNLIFEEALFVYFGNKTMRELGDRISPYVPNYVQNGRLNMEHVLVRFRDLLHEEYRDSTQAFVEKEGRLLFLTFLKPIINGTGFYYVEPQTRDNRRMDLIVTYGREEFVVELKIWRGDKYEQKGRDQLSEYLATRGKDEGYLVTFDFSKNKEEKEPEWIEWNGKRIFEAVI